MGGGCPGTGASPLSCQGACRDTLGSGTCHGRGAESAEANRDPGFTLGPHPAAGRQEGGGAKCPVTEQVRMEGRRRDQKDGQDIRASEHYRGCKTIRGWTSEPPRVTGG